MVAPIGTLRGRLVLLIGGLLAAVSLVIFIYFPVQMERRAIAAQVFNEPWRSGSGWE